MMKFYRISHNSARSSGYAWASGYGPLCDMWFLSEMSLKSNREFWAVNPREPGLYIDSGAAEWPDVLGCGNAPPLFFLSERIISSMENNGVSFKRVTHIPIARIDSKKLLLKHVPRYFVAEAYPGIEVDIPASGFKTDPSGTVIVDTSPAAWPKQYVYSERTWSGADVFSSKKLIAVDGPNLTFLCTDKIKEVAEKEGWKNMRFQPLLLA